MFLYTVGHLVRHCLTLRLTNSTNRQCFFFCFSFCRQDKNWARASRYVKTRSNVREILAEPWLHWDRLALEHWSSKCTTTMQAGYRLSSRFASLHWFDIWWNKCIFHLGMEGVLCRLRVAMGWGRFAPLSLLMVSPASCLISFTAVSEWHTLTS